ncbi:Nif3-like dinuclear metal center hexameric protein [Enterovibrio nigricans]|uniref:GTP cyclohydrolase 1 type 2 homolog n=1 Tax=Enterovibrio nigricans DSM 22720 TaxID=1121868 RepID=A0A1T4V2X8_9GAMM|nr:Nif3-like dinuclear metal center hexameric protein [Enterovibrio nigricans]PKF50528.1 Nif3-like dinuclear metal center hexameric protein [Enterovibrio nigricans]SKA59278.1 dinuclear metal center protein, YbgI/SA1388 family [Enterovibrio nigricans DSM 22720]
MNNIELESILNGYLKPFAIKDYCPNGMQVEGKESVTKIVTGVTACQALIDAAIEQNADAILVHHGYFWRGEAEPLRGMKLKRIKALIENGINLYAYHLPLDVHPEVGNNAQLAMLLGIEQKGGLEEGNPNSVAVWGELPQPMTAKAFGELLETKLSRQPLHIESGNDALISRIGWCTGGGQDFIDLAASKGMDAFISGEVSERTTFSAKEQGIHYYGAGHHATERYGVKVLGEWLASEHGLDVTFIDINNPV